MVHNGIIENFQELKDRLTARGYAFASQTDTEVVAQLVDFYYTGESAGDPLDAITRMMLHVRGSYALGVLFADQPGVIYAVRKDSPLIVGQAENGNLIASDVPALLKYTRTVYYIDNLEIARLTPDSIEFFNIDKEPVEKDPTTIEWDAEAAEKGGFEHFMMKEIHEQPAAVRDTLSPRIKDGRIDLSEVNLDEETIRAVSRLYIIGCGSAYHVGVAARYVFESLARLPVEVDVASEFRYRDPVLEDDALAVIISQSGETADSLAALRECKEPRRAHAGHRQRGGQLHRPGGRRGALHLGRPRDRRGHHQGLLHPAGGRLPAGHRVRPGARRAWSEEQYAALVQ